MAKVKVPGDVNYVGRLFQSGLRVLTALQGEGAPTVTPGYIGQFYVDTLNGDQYQAYSLSGWQKNTHIPPTVGVIVSDDNPGNPENLRANRSTQPPTINVANYGQTHLGSLGSTDANHATVAGGQVNNALGQFSAIGGGFTNRVDGEYATIAGGRFNQASDDYSVIAGGQDNYTNSSSPHASVLGGDTNQVLTSPRGTIGGGVDNTLTSADDATIAGGDTNSITATHGAIGGGEGNGVGGVAGVIAGGKDNEIEASSPYGAVVGGQNNTIETGHTHSFMGGGLDNVMAQAYGSLPGGRVNQVNGAYGSVGGGFNNVVNDSYSTIPGGRDNAVESIYGTAFGRGSIVNESYGVAHGLYATSDDYGSLAHGSGRFVASGDAQIASVLLRKISGGATSNILETFGGGEIAVALGRTVQFEALVVAREFAGNLFFAAEVRGVANRNTSGTMVLAGVSTTYWHRPSVSYTIAASVGGSGLLRFTAAQPSGPDMYWKAHIRQNWAGYL